MKALSSLLDELKEQACALETERDHRTAPIRAQLNSLESEYQSRLQGLHKAIDGLTEAMGAVASSKEISAPHQPTPTARYPRLQDVLREILKAEATQRGQGMTLDDLTSEALRRGARIESSVPPQAVRSSIYAMKEKGEPVVLVAPRTWSWGFTNDENNANETQVAP